MIKDIIPNGEQSMQYESYSNLHQAKNKANLYIITSRFCEERTERTFDNYL